MEAKNGGLEDDFPFQLGDFVGSMLIFGNVFICLRDHQTNHVFSDCKRVVQNVWQKIV